MNIGIIKKIEPGSKINIKASYLPQLMFGSPVKPLSQVQNGLPVAYTTWHTALVPLQIILSHGSRLEKDQQRALKN